MISHKRRTGFLAFVLVSALQAAGCGGRTIGGPADDGSTRPDGADADGSSNTNNTNRDGGTVDPDGGTVCGTDPLAAGFVIGTHIQPQHPEPMIDDYYVDGTVFYMGAITVPLASNPLFDREVQVMHADGQATILQYYLPQNLDLPLQEGLEVNLVFRRRNGFEGYTVGVVIHRPTSGLPPLLFVGETGAYGRAFEAEDPLMNPVKVYAMPDPNCPTHPDPMGCGTVHLDALLFDTSTGGVITQLELYQGQSGSLPVFGQPFYMLNMASTRVVPGCLDDPAGRVAFLAIIEQGWM